MENFSLLKYKLPCECIEWDSKKIMGPDRQPSICILNSVIYNSMFKVLQNRMRSSENPLLHGIAYNILFIDAIS